MCIGKRGMRVLISIFFDTICTTTSSVMLGCICSRGTRGTTRSIRCARCVSIAGIPACITRRTIVAHKFHKQEQTKTKTGQMNDEAGRKICHPMKERTHCPQKYMSTMSSTQGQCVHMKKKRIMILPTSVLMWQNHEKTPPLFEKIQNCLPHQCWQ